MRQPVPPESRPAVTADRSSPSQYVNVQRSTNREQHVLLQRRLRITFSLMSFALFCYLVAFGKNMSAGDLVGIFLLNATSLIPTVLLRTKKEFSRAALSWFELILFGYGFIAVIVLALIRISDIETLPHTLDQIVAPNVPSYRIFISLEGALFTKFSASMICNTIIINAALLAVGFSVMIPTTWRRASVIMVLVVLMALALVAYVGYRHPGFRTNLGNALFYTGFVVSVFAMMGLYGCHKLDTLRTAVIAARQVGPYQLKHQLGKGANGEVYMAQHSLLRRPCAVKLIRVERADDAYSLARFEREVQAMAQLTHPNTVEIYDYGRSDDGTFYYAMEYLPGLSVEDLINRHGPLPAGRAIYLLHQVCGALEEAHAAGMIHRAL